jgi:hypothetical protein
MARDITERSTSVTGKIDQARRHIGELSEILDWFLFSGSIEERNFFRDELGESWKDLLWFTRSMTGETAFEIQKREGRPKRKNNQLSK